MTLKNPIPEYLEYSGKHVVICAGTHLLASALVVKVNIPFRHRVIKLRSHLNVVTSVGDSVVTLKNTAGVAWTGGVLTITNAGAAVADRDTSTAITAGEQVQAKDTDVQISIDGGSDAGEATFWLEVEHSDP
jgi:hypothetical protein